MTDPTMALMEYLSEFGLHIEDDFVREGIRVLIQAVIEAKVTQRIGAEHYERSSEKVAQRNGYRERLYETRVGELTLPVPRAAGGRLLPFLPGTPPESGEGPAGGGAECLREGVSTRRVDNLLRALSLTSIDKSQVSRICKDLHEPVGASRERALAGDYPYVWLDATYLKVRQNHHIVNMAAVVAIGIRETGEREVLSFAVGASEEASFWVGFLRSLVRRGLRRVRLVVSDAHEGPKAALDHVLIGAAWQRCGYALCATFWPMSPGRIGRWSPRRCAPFSPSPIAPRLASNWRWSPRPWLRAGRTQRSFLGQQRRKCWPTWPSLSSTGRASTPPTHWSG